MTNRVLVEKLSGRLHWLNRYRCLIEPAPLVDVLPAEITAIERAVARELAKTRGKRRNRLRLEPVTREEKILDLAG